MFALEDYTEFAQLIVAFCLGVLFSPWSWGFVYYLLFIIGYELVCGWMSFRTPYWHFTTRLGVVFASLFGFIVGRIIVGYHNPF